MCPSCLLGGFAKPGGSERAGSQPDTTQSEGAIEFALTSEELQEKFPDLEILDLLGFGGMGAVYLARQTRLDRLVALKVLSCSPERYEAFSLRFEQEARVLARLQHPHIVGLYDLGELEDGGPDGLPLFYFTMEYVEGADLRVRLRNESMSADVALSIGEQLCDALQCAHDVGVVHRDIKPANILVGPDNTAKIADFGIARIVRNLDDTEDITRLTLTGTSLGTPQYTAPEQWNDLEGVDHRADIFSVGVLLYEMLTGTVAVGVFDAPSQKADVDETVDALVLRAMNRDPDRRFATAGELQTAIAEARRRRCEARSSWRGRKGRAMVVILGVLAGAVLAGGLFRGFRERAGEGDAQDKMPATPGAASAIPEIDALPPDLAPRLPATGEVCSPGRLRVWGQLDNGSDPAPTLAVAAGIDDFVEITVDSGGSWAARRSSGEYVTYGFDTFVADRRWTSLNYQHSNCPAGLTSEGRFWWIEKRGPQEVRAQKAGKFARFSTGNNLAYTINTHGKLQLHFMESAETSLDLDADVMREHEDHCDALERIVQVSSCDRNAVALAEDGKVSAWHLGLGVVPTPEHVVDVIRVACGAHDYYAIDSSGKLMTWSSPVFDDVHLKPPEDLGKVIDLRINREVCAVQFEDGSWRAWQTRRESDRSYFRYQNGQQLIEKINGLGPVRDLAFFAKNGNTLLYWIEPHDFGA